MAIQQAPTPQHWNYFLALEDDVGHLSRYLEPTEANFEAYSLELVRILFAAASEIDVVAGIDSEVWLIFVSLGTLGPQRESYLVEGVQQGEARAPYTLL